MLGETKSQPVRRSSSDWVAFSFIETLGDKSARSWIDAKKANPTAKNESGFGKNSDVTAIPRIKNGLNWTKKKSEPITVRTCPILLKKKMTLS